MPAEREFYDFGPFRLDAGRRVLLREGEPLPGLTPKVVETLVALVRRGGDIVAKDELMEAVWPDAHVEESNLTSNISLLRKALGAAADGRPYIETFPKRGYRFNLAPARAPATPPAEEVEADLLIRRTTRRVLRHEETTEQEDARDADSRATPAVVPRPEPLPAARASNRRRKLVVVSVLLAAALALALFLAGGALRGRGPGARRVKISRLTANGIASHAAVSPDGKYVVHVAGEEGRHSLQLKHVATGSDTEIVPPGPGLFTSLTFSPEGDYVYYIKYENSGRVYRVPILGGRPHRLAIDDVDGSLTFSPDGKRFAFNRGYPHEGHEDLLAADADGTGERTLFVGQKFELFPSSSKVSPWGPAWSPDGKWIAFARRVVDERGPYKRVDLLSVADGRTTPLTSHRFNSTGALQWLRDGSGLVLNAGDAETGIRHQLWHVSYPGGEARRLTNDLHNYNGVSLTADGGALVSVQTEERSALWVAPLAEAAGRPRQFPSDRRDGAEGLAWTPDGRIVYASGVGGNLDIWVMDADGGNRRQLTDDPRRDRQPAVTPDGRHVVFASNREGPDHLWRMDLDGGNLVRLTNGKEDSYPAVSPDGRWVVYVSESEGKRTLWKVSVEGGEAVRLTEHAAVRPAVSPDGRFVVFSYPDKPANRWRVGLIPFEGGEMVQRFEAPLAHTQVFRWLADGSAFTYLDARAGVSNVWRQPLDGGPAAPLTSFTEQTIFNYALAPGGGALALARGSLTTDVVLVRDFR